MGCKQSQKVCNSCRIINGSTPILEVYHHGQFGGKFLCTNCFIIHSDKKNVKIKNINNDMKISECKFCFNKNLNYFSDHNFKIHWYGKYNKKIMCEKCFFKKYKEII